MEFSPPPSIANFVNAGQPLTVANLLASFPAGSSFMGMYARV